MKTFILFTKLTPELSQHMKQRSKIGRAWLDQVKEKCPDVKFISHYALLGEYDFIDIYEAPDEKTATKVSLISLANGALEAKSIMAIGYKDFLDIIDEL